MSITWIHYYHQYRSNIWFSLKSSEKVHLKYGHPVLAIVCALVIAKNLMCHFIFCKRQLAKVITT